MVAFAPLFQVVALDLRGYNLSDKPLGREHYSMHHLVEDVQAVIHHLKRDKAIIIGHDWGGAIAWFFAIGLPTLTERLIMLNSGEYKNRIKLGSVTKFALLAINTSVTMFCFCKCIAANRESNFIL
jgi:pimeloyl-ACP methyl ester carboxylesterase